MKSIRTRKLRQLCGLKNQIFKGKLASGISFLQQNFYQSVFQAEVKVNRNGPERRSGKRIIACTVFR